MATETTNPTNIPDTLKSLAVPIGGLKHYAKNARKGNLGVIMESLELHGQYRPVVVRTGTNEILAGNHTVMAARELGWDQVAVTFVDVDDDKAARIVLIDNRANDLGDYDQDALMDLINSVDSLEGTGFTDVDLKDMLEELDNGDDSIELEEDTKGQALDLFGVTVGEPDITPENGSVWQLGDHVLVVCDVHKDWAQWVPYLEEGAAFWPYPSLLAPFTDRAQSTPLVLVQPNPYLAGWTLTKWNNLMEEQAVELLDAPEAAAAEQAEAEDAEVSA